jgi:pimeloyl-ACP methyl ester carboxylesterase
MKHLGSTPTFIGSAGQPVVGSIAEVGYLRLGGLDQWVMLRGESVVNPPLIFLHGGPGMTEMRYFRHFNAALEKRFTVVNWDQRGAAKSFDRTIPQSSMTVEQFIDDLDELVSAVCKRLGKHSVVIFGHSWGSVLGVLYAARFPKKVAAYVGSGQIGNWPQSEVASYSYVLAEAQRRHDDKALKKLRGIGPPPHTVQQLWAVRICLQNFEGQLAARALWNMGRIMLGSPESSLFDLPNLLRGFRFSLDAMWAEVSRLNLLEAAPALQMPVFFFLGRRDHWVPPQTSVSYFEALTAPSKKLVWFEQSGHEPFVDEAAKFNAAMVDLVRPAVGGDLATGSRHASRQDADD